MREACFSLLHVQPEGLLSGLGEIAFQATDHQCHLVEVDSDELRGEIVLVEVDVQVLGDGKPGGDVFLSRLPVHVACNAREGRVAVVRDSILLGMALSICAVAPQPFSEAWRTSPAPSSSRAFCSSSNAPCRYESVDMLMFPRGDSSIAKGFSRYRKRTASTSPSPYKCGIIPAEVGDDNCRKWK